MSWLSDDAVSRLRNIAEWPDFSGTRYTIVREIGRGGMGVVYEAEDVALRRSIAIKVLANEMSSTRSAERMRREAQIIAGLEHPAIVPVHDVGELPDGRIYYAMRLVRGRTLDAYAAEGHATPELMRVFLRICEAVAFAHASNVVHRDLKPQNVMIGEFGSVLVMDRGLATATGSRDVAAGTPGFMAPEHERAGDEAIDPTADVYALGVILRTMFAEERMPRRLQAVSRKAMSAERGSRYASAREMADDIVRFLDGEAMVAYRENPFERLGRWGQRNRALITVVAAYLIMRVIVFLWIRR
ncbi:MAG: serine/threonine-protein kinase [Thermoanaerobaculia bacterium]